MIKITMSENQTIVKPDQDIVSSTASDFRNELFDIIKTDPDELVIDFSDIKMIDSIGLGVLITIHNSMNHIDGKLIVINVSKDIHKLFLTMRLDRHFEIYPSSSNETE